VTLWKIFGCLLCVCLRFRNGYYIEVCNWAILGLALLFLSISVTRRLHMIVLGRISRFGSSVVKLVNQSTVPGTNQFVRLALHYLSAQSS
jgi:hypothetical protein